MSTHRFVTRLDVVTLEDILFPLFSGLQLSFFITLSSHPLSWNNAIYGPSRRINSLAQNIDIKIPVYHGFAALCRNLTEVHFRFLLD